MFDSISNEYDYLNKIITFGSHSKWKKEMAEIAKSKKPKKILDIATGTADIPIHLSSIKDCKIIGVDISKKMLALGRKKIKSKNLSNNISLDIGSAENLKFSNNSFDVLTIGFGVRNFQNLSKSLKESFRVLKRSGYLIILETSLPKNRFINFFYLAFSRLFIPLVGYFFSKNPKAYLYLQKSAEIFPSGKNFTSLLLNIGFRKTEIRNKFFGALSIYIAEK